MPAVFRSAFAPREQPDALVIHCSDPRFQKHFHEFRRAHLGLDTYGLVAVPGGAQFLTMIDYLPKFSWVGWRYKDLRFWQHGGDWKSAALSDLAKVRDGLCARFGSLGVETWFARIDGGEVVFEAAGS